MWWRRLRLINLIIIGGLILLMYSQLTENDHAFPNLLVLLHALSISLVAGGSYLHNHLVDQVSDRINRGLVEDQKRTTLLVRMSSLMSSTGVAAAVLHGMLSESFALAILALVMVIVLYAYSRWLQATVLWGNLVVAAACALVIISIPLAQPDLWRFKTVLLGFSFFAFLTTLAREIVKDLEDVAGDRAVGQRTLAVVRPEMSRLIALISMILTAGLLLWSLFLLADQQTIGSKIMVGILLLLACLLCLRIRSTVETLGWKLLSLWLKMFMLLGIFLLIFLRLA